MGPDMGEGWGGMSTNHVVSHSVRDSAAFLDVVAGPESGDPYYAPPIERPYLEEVGRDPGKLRVAFTTTTPTGMNADESCQAAVAATVKLCESLGHSLEEAAPEVDQKALGKATNTIINANILNSLEQRAKTLGRECTQDDVETITWLHAEGGKKSNSGEYAQAIQIIHGIGRKVAPFFEKFDVLLSPVLLKPPIPLGTLNMMGEGKPYVEALFGFFGFTGLFNATGQPSMSVPLFWTEQNLPVGLQFTARFGAEDLLFRLATQLEQARPWADKHPSLLKE